MQQFSFNVVDSADPEAEVPDQVAARIMGDVQRLLADEGELLVRRELRTQGPRLEGMEGRFDLSEAGTGPRGDETLLEDALAVTVAELDRASLRSSIPEEPDNHIEAMGRRRIAADMLALAEGLEGYTLTYGDAKGTRKFRMNNRAALEKEASADVSAKPSAAVGIVSRDPERSGRWLFSNGDVTVPITFADWLEQDEIASYSKAGPVIAAGRVFVGEDGRISEVREVSGCYMFPLVKFRRIVAPGRDIVLLNPVVACPGYSARRGLWTLRQEDIGIDVAKPSWDEAVAAFHDQFVFLWDTYVSSDAEFEGEEAEVSSFMRSLAFP